MLAGLSVKAVEQHGVCRAVLSCQLQLGIVDNDVPVVSNSQLLAYLQNNLCACAWCRHKSSLPQLFFAVGMPSWMRHHTEKAHGPIGMIYGSERTAHP